MLADVIPAKYRKAVYALVGTASALAAIPGLIPGPLAAKVVAALAALSSLLAAGNTASV